MATVLGFEAAKPQTLLESSSVEAVKETRRVPVLDVPLSGGIVHVSSGGMRGASGETLKAASGHLVSSAIAGLADSRGKKKAEDWSDSSSTLNSSFSSDSYDDLVEFGTSSSTQGTIHRSETVDDFRLLASSSTQVGFSDEESKQIRKALRVSKKSPFKERLLDFLKANYTTFQVADIQQKLSSATVIRVLTDLGDQTFKIFELQKHSRSDASIMLSREEVGEEWQALLRGATDVIAYHGEGESGRFVRISKQDLKEYLALKKAASEGSRGAEAALRKNKLALILLKGPLQAVGVLTSAAPWGAHFRIAKSFGSIQSGGLNKQKCERFLEVAFPEMTFIRDLGSGTFATAKQVRTPEGMKVLRVLQLEKAVHSKDALKTTHLSSGRIGGEWLSLLLSGENTVNTQEVIAYQKETGHFFRINQQEFNEYLELKEAAKSGHPIDHLALGQNRIAQALNKGPLIAIGTLAEYYPGAKDLITVLQDRTDPVLYNFNYFSQEQTRDLAYQMTQGLVDMHKIAIDGREFAHRDVKPENILVTADGRLLHFDTGLSRLMPQDGKRLSHVGSPAYAAPEIILTRDETYQKNVDAYSLFATLFVLAAGEYPHSTKTLMGLFRALEAQGKFQETAPLSMQYEQMKARLKASPMAQDPEFIMLLVELNQHDPSKRISVQEAFENHAFFKQVRARRAESFSHN